MRSLIVQARLLAKWHSKLQSLFLWDVLNTKTNFP